MLQHSNFSAPHLYIHIYIHIHVYLYLYLHIYIICYASIYLPTFVKISNHLNLNHQCNFLYWILEYPILPLPSSSNQPPLHFSSSSLPINLYIYIACRCTWTRKIKGGETNKRTLTYKQSWLKRLSRYDHVYVLFLWCLISCSFLNDFNAFMCFQRRIENFGCHFFGVLTSCLFFVISQKKYDYLFLLVFLLVFSVNFLCNFSGRKLKNRIKGQDVFCSVLEIFNVALAIDLYFSCNANNSTKRLVQDLLSLW